jgi:hypothetical protein
VSGILLGIGIVAYIVGMVGTFDGLRSLGGQRPRVLWTGTFLWPCVFVYGICFIAAAAFEKRDREFSAEKAKSKEQS